MDQPKTNEPGKEPAQNNPQGPSTTRTVHVVTPRKPAAPAQAATPPPAAKKDEPKPAVEPPEPAEKPQRGKGINPGKKLRSIELAGKNAPRAKIPLKNRLRPNVRLLPRALLNISHIASLGVNIVLTILLIVVGMRVKLLMSMVNNLLGGLYNNFVLMDNSTISTTITVNQEIPLDFMLPVVQEETYVTLTRDVTIQGARVGILSLPTTVTLPRGTSLPISLNIEVPVKRNIPISLTVPVNIKLAEAIPADVKAVNLHSAFIGLQNTIGPYYCLLQPGAIDPIQRPVCEQGVYPIKRAR